MNTIEIPQLRAADVLAVQIEQAELAGRFVWVVTLRASVSGPPQRRWFPDEALALAYAAQEADRLGQLLIDLRDQGELP